jgi:hypothetical protein
MITAMPMPRANRRPGSESKKCMVGFRDLTFDLMEFDPGKAVP